jgi:hypothetical protein
MPGGLVLLLGVVAAIVFYLLAGVLVARVSAHRLYGVNVRYVRNQRGSRTWKGNWLTDPLTEAEMATVFREIRRDQRDMIIHWPGEIGYLIRSRRGRRDVAAGWMVAGARAAHDEVAGARAALEVWEAELADDAMTDMHREAAQLLVDTTRERIKRLEGRN